MNRKERRAASKHGLSGALNPAARSASAADVSFRSALEFHKQGRFPKADSLYRQALQLDPRHADSLRFLGLLSFQAGRIDEAAAFLDRALGIAPDNPNLLYNVATAYRTLGRQDEAMAHYRRAIQLQPNHQDAHNNLGAALHECGRHSDAAEAFQKALALGPDARVHSNFGGLRLTRETLTAPPSISDKHCS